MLGNKLRKLQKEAQLRGEGLAAEALRAEITMLVSNNQAITTCYKISLEVSKVLRQNGRYKY